MKNEDKAEAEDIGRQYIEYQLQNWRNHLFETGRFERASLSEMAWWNFNLADRNIPLFPHTEHDATLIPIMVFSPRGAYCVGAACRECKKEWRGKERPEPGENCMVL